VDRKSLEREAGEVLEAFLRSSLVERFREVEILDRELPLILAGEDGRLYRGYIDMLYRDPAGELVVADFKTDRDSDPNRLRETYAAQLDAYGRAVQLALGLPAPPRVELWHLRSGGVIPLLT
jgi:ATP-dependent helicase/nuclease subunit A